MTSWSVAAAGQEPAPHEHTMPMPMSSTADDTAWMFMQDGVVWALANHQGGRRGGDEFRVPNWWMGMATKKAGRSQWTLTSMFSLDPATVGERGYREVFQAGEAIDGEPLIDRQHPHDFFMQLAAVWRIGLTDRTGFTLAGGPVGEPALGPVAFMHRASAGEIPLAPLGHHTFDSTHIAFGAVTAAIDHGPFVLEGSVFNGREPDRHRWNIEVGKLDSVSGRLWYKPSPPWELQVSTGHLKDPEELEPGNIERTTASASWTKQSGADMTAVTVAYGVNQTDHGTRRAMLAEMTRRRGAVAGFGRFELLQPEIAVLLHDTGSNHAEPGSEQAALAAFTAGGVRDVMHWRGFEGAVAAAVTVYAVPDVLQSSYGNHPVSFQLFFRLRPPAPMGRMWNMRMSQPRMDEDGMSH
ncbi:MAG: hypothetical protein ABI818_09985 [Acidobacteriota bacterium]